jgi:hypothetical protein
LHNRHGGVAGKYREVREMIEDKQEAIAARIKAIGKSAERTECQIFTRVMGYHRPVESFNLGKKGEHADRVGFVEPITPVGGAEWSEELCSLRQHERAVGRGVKPHIKRS